MVVEEVVVEEKETKEKETETTERRKRQSATLGDSRFTA